MISKTIKVEYMINKKTGKIGFNLNEIADKGQKGYEVDYVEWTHTFTKFTNKGKVSKSEKSKYEIVNEKAEKLFQSQLKIEDDREADTKRALKLVEIVNNSYMKANKRTKWTTIKTKTSHSKWYQYGGLINSPSLYLTQVPVNVEKEARELQAIRRKHQNDKKFNFEETAYFTRKVRIADHDNGRDSI